MIEAEILHLLFVPDGPHLLANYQPVEVDIAVLYWVLCISGEALALFLTFLFLTGHSLPNDIIDLLFKIVNVLELFYWLKLHTVLAKLLDVSVGIGNLHVAELLAVI